MALTDNPLKSVVHVEKCIKRACDHLSHRELPLPTGKRVHVTSSREDDPRKPRGSDIPGVPESLGCDSSVGKARFKGVKEKNSSDTCQNGKEDMIPDACDVGREIDLSAKDS